MAYNKKDRAIGLADMSRELLPRRLGPLVLSLDAANLRVGRAPSTLDARITAQWGKRKYTFEAELKARSTPQAFEAAVSAVGRRLATRDGSADGAKTQGMIVLPYLNDDALRALPEMGLSGIDLSGNGIVVVPDELYVYRSGERNQYPESPPTKYAYRGATALVPRAFLIRPEYPQVSAIQTEIERRGATIALATVSKALKRMESDALITRRDGAIRLLQPEMLLDKLRASYQPPRLSVRRALALSESLEAFLAARPPDVVAMLSGASLVARYAVMGRSDPPVVYCREPLGRNGWWKALAREDERFPNVVLYTTTDDWVFFDAREENGIRYASPVQTYLELATGEQREQQAAEQIRERILTELPQWTPS